MRVWAKSFGARLLGASLALVILAAVIVAVRDPFDIDDRPHIRRIMKLAANSAEADLAAELEARSRALTRIARLGTLRGISHENWVSSAEFFLSHHPGYVSIQLLDLAHKTHRFVALQHDSGAQAIDVDTEPAIRRVLENMSQRWREEQLAGVGLRLANGKTGCLLIVPSLVDEEHVGFLIAVLDLEKAFDHMFADHSELGYSVAVLQDGNDIYRTDTDTQAIRGAWSQTAQFRVANLNWQLEAWPKPEMIAQFRSRFPEMALISATLLVLLLASTIHFARMTHIKSLDLRASRDQLESRVLERTEELRKTNDRLQAEIVQRTQAEEALRKLSVRLLHSQDEERRRIARELHDSTAQTLSTVRMNVCRLRQLVPDDGSKLRAIIDDAEQLTSQAVAEIRTISFLLHPASLDDLGLKCAVEWYVAGFSERSGIQTQLKIAPDFTRLPADLEVTLFRIVQEALGNIHRHSGSRNAQISLSCSAQEVTLLIADQGCGLPEEALATEGRTSPRLGVGIASMRERVREFQGNLLIASDARGTAITVTIPLAEARKFANA